MLHRLNGFHRERFSAQWVPWFSKEFLNSVMPSLCVGLPPLFLHCFFAFVSQMLEEVSAAPFSGEDSFTQFTSDMVRLMKEEEVRAKHQAGLLRLREKAVKEKTRAEMSWLECQKQRHRDKGADDVMPSIRKRQRGVLMRLQAEQVGSSFERFLKINQV